MLPKWINFIIVLLIAFISIDLAAQTNVFTIESALENAVNNHPLNGQKNLIADKTDLNIKSLRKKNLPNIDLNAQASLQSESIDLEFPLPKFEPITLPLYRAQTYLESNYLLYDGGIKKSLINNEKLKAKIGGQSIATELFKLKDKVVDVYFGILLLYRQKEILDSSMIVLNTQEKIVTTAINNGVALKSDLDKINLEKIKINQSKSAIDNKIKTLKVVLSDLTGTDINDKSLADVKNIKITNYDSSNRPEKLLFDYKKQLLSQSKDIISAKKKPKVILFAKAGVGYPNPFNFFDDNIAPYAIGGVKFVWNIYDWKKSSVEKQKLDIEQSFIDNQNAVLDNNIKMQANKLVSEIQGIEANEHFDKEIIEKQNTIINTIKNQYQNGVVKINDYIKEVNVKKIAEIKSAIHKLEKEKLKYKLKVLLNK